MLRSHGELREELLEASVNPKFGSTLARRLNQSCFFAVLQSNQITIKVRHGRSTTSELGLTKYVDNPNTKQQQQQPYYKFKEHFS